MTTQCKMLTTDEDGLGHDAPTTAGGAGSNGYVKSSSKYFVTDNLEIFPSSHSLALLKKLKVENMSSLDSIELCVGTDEVLKLLRASLTSVTVLNDVFSKPLRETHACAFESCSPHFEILPPGNPSAKSSDVRPLKESIEIARDWGRELYKALREVQDAAFHSSLVNYVREREQRISSALRDLNTTPSTPSDASVAGRSSSTGSNCKRMRKRGDGEYAMPAPCKEMLMLERQVDKVMARLCRLTSAHNSQVSNSGRPKSARPPWTTLSHTRVRLPSRVWHP